MVYAFHRRHIPTPKHFADIDHFVGLVGRKDPVKASAPKPLLSHERDRKRALHLAYRSAAKKIHQGGGTKFISDRRASNLVVREAYQSAVDRDRAEDVDAGLAGFGGGRSADINVDVFEVSCVRGGTNRAVLL